MEDETGDLNTDDLLGGAGPLKSKKKKKFILPILILIILALLVLAIKLDIGKVSTNFIGPRIKNIPIINKILPKASENEEGPYDDFTDREFIDTIGTSTAELERAKQEIEDQFLQIVDLEKRIENLQVFEDEYLTFKEEKRIFDEYVAAGNTEEFAQFYQQMYPENAQEVYAQIVQVQQMTKEQRKYASLVSEMDGTRAAKVLENLFETDMDIILAILSNMETESASAILEEMEAEIAAAVIKQLSPE